MAQPGHLERGHRRRDWCRSSCWVRTICSSDAREPCPPDARWKRCSSVRARLALGISDFDRTPAGPNTSPALLYTPIPLLIWAALRFGLGGISVSMLIVTVQAIWGTMRGHGPFLAQTPAENATALQLFLLVTATPLMLLAVVIEEERRSKEALRESANLMGLAAEAANLAMWVWDVSGNDVWMTERGRSLFGFEPDARLGFAATFDRVHPDDRAAREAAIRQAIETRGEYEMEYRLQQADGMAQWIHGRGRCVRPDDGSNPKLFGVSMDVTARKQAEASAAQKRAELEHVARVATLGELTSTLTHELRQPLAAILANAYAGGRLLDAPQPDLQRCAGRSPTFTRSPSVPATSSAGSAPCSSAKVRRGA